MSLKKYTFAEKRKIELDAITKHLMQIEYPGGRHPNISVSSNVIQYLFSNSSLTNTNILDNTKFIYGYIDKTNDNNSNELEWKLVVILFLFRLCEFALTTSHNNINYWDGLDRIKANKLRALLPNVKSKLDNLFAQEYKIHWLKDAEKIEWIKYEPIETKTIIDNLQDIDEQTVNPIIQLLKPMQSKNDLIANISLSHKEIEKVNMNNLNNLNEVDRSIAKNAWKLAKQLVNNVDGAKGHKGKSELIILDIAHNYALNVSLVHKLIQLNQNKEK